MSVRTVKALIKKIKVYYANVVQKLKNLYGQKTKKMCEIMVVILEVPTSSFVNLMMMKSRNHVGR